MKIYRRKQFYKLTFTKQQTIIIIVVATTIWNSIKYNCDHCSPGIKQVTSQWDLQCQSLFWGFSHQCLRSTEKGGKTPLFRSIAGMASKCSICLNFDPLDLFKRHVVSGSKGTGVDRTPRRSGIEASHTQDDIKDSGERQCYTVAIGTNLQEAMSPLLAVLHLCYLWWARSPPVH